MHNAINIQIQGTISKLVSLHKPVTMQLFWCILYSLYMV